MNDRIERMAKEYAATRKKDAENYTGIETPAFVILSGNVWFHSSELVAAFRSGSAAGAAQHRDERDPAWHEPIVAREQTRD